MGEGVLQVYEIGFGKRLRPKADLILTEVGLEARLWQDEFEGFDGEWLRWFDASSSDMILPGKESAAQMAQKLRDAGIDF